MLAVLSVAPIGDTRTSTVTPPAVTFQLNDSLTAVRNRTLNDLRHAGYRELAKQRTSDSEQLNANAGPAVAVQQTISSEVIRLEESSPAVPHHFDVLLSRHPEFVDEARRIESFRHRNVPSGQNVIVLTEAGFFHSGE